MSSFCMGCGNSLSKDERYCGICGRDSQAQAAPVDPSVAFGLPPETSGKAIFSLVTGFLFFFCPLRLFRSCSDICRFTTFEKAPDSSPAGAWQLRESCWDISELS